MEASPHPWPVLGSLLVRDGVLTEEELEAALAQQRISGKRLGEVLVNRGAITSTQVARGLAEQYELPFIEFDASEVERDAISVLPEELARRYAALPVSFLTDGRLVVAIADPSCVLYSEELRTAFSVPVRFAISAPDAIEAAIGYAYGSADSEPYEHGARDEDAPVEVAFTGATLVEAEPVAHLEDQELTETEEPPSIESELRLERVEMVDNVELPYVADGQPLEREQLLEREEPAEGDEHPDVPGEPQLQEQLAESEGLQFTEGHDLRQIEGEELAASEEPTSPDGEQPGQVESESASSPLAVVVDIYSGETDRQNRGRVEETIERALSGGAYDIHFTPQPHGLVVRGRVDGVVRELDVISGSLVNEVTDRLKTLGGLKVDVRRAPQQGRFAFRVGDARVDLRIAVIPTKHGEKVTLRAPRNGSRPRSLADLKMALESEETVRVAIEEPFGIVLACGPVGSGRTTTLYAALHELNTQERVIATIEDPVEHVMPGIDQTDVDPGVGLSFVRGLRLIRDSDPDVIMISEIRDRETARLALDAATAGRLILSTLHAQTTAQALQRLADMAIEPGLLGATLTCLVAQRLARRVCQDCRETYYASADELAQLGRPVEESGRRLLARGRGCDTCGGTGYKGRVGLFEVLPLTDEIRMLVAKRASTTELERAAVEAGMKTLRDDGIRLCLEGITTAAELRRVAGDQTRPEPA